MIKRGELPTPFYFIPDQKEDKKKFSRHELQKLKSKFSNSNKKGRETRWNILGNIHTATIHGYYTRLTPQRQGKLFWNIIKVNPPPR